MIAAENGHLLIVKLLKDYGADIYAVNNVNVLLPFVYLFLLYFVLMTGWQNCIDPRRSKRIS
jgi:ankyrin repeat protein